MIESPEILDRSKLLQAFKECRNRTEEICKPLKIEDYSVQPVDFVSPPKWHLAHSTWFFEQFILNMFIENYEEFNSDFSYLFNSYYNNKGDRVLRPNRGNMTRPTVSEVLEYRKSVTEEIIRLLQGNPDDELISLMEIGINHEQQHQELLIYDIKYILGHQPTFPSYSFSIRDKKQPSAPAFLKLDKGLYQIGHQGKGFSFDNERGSHKVYLNSFEISNALVTNKEYLEFINAGGYKNFNLWHADGWDWVNENDIEAPMYWYKKNDDWFIYDFTGLRHLRHDEAVMHISFYEAYAFAEWKGLRLPTEFEWEVAQEKFNWGELWEWTNSAYLPYPNFKTAEGALGEYNGKFMINQMVLRGASSASPNGHSRYTYRNFFQPEMRWMFSGIRLAK